MQKAKSRSGRKTVKIIAIIFAVCLYIASTIAILLPYCKIEFPDKNAKQTASVFIQTTKETRIAYNKISTENAAAPNVSFEEYVYNNKSTIPHSDLLLDMLSYNEQIRQEHQAGLSDAFSYASECFELSSYGLENEVVATVEIPALNSTLPLYLGASSQHLNVGLAQLTETSMPIGGLNTNCVVAGHRGWNNGKYLKDIENIKVGDIITVTNIWYEMKYQVCEIRIIDKSDVEQILIENGRDLFTLMTCHPYGTGGRYYRYLVICERMSDDTPLGYSQPTVETENSTIETNHSASENGKTVIYSPGNNEDPYIPYFSSEKEIFYDDLLHYIGLGFILLLPIVVIIAVIQNRHKKKKKRQSL